MQMAAACTAYMYDGSDKKNPILKDKMSDSGPFHKLFQNPVPEIL